MWGVDVPTPVYFNDFSSTTGLTQVGSGEFVTDTDARFGKIYHNNPAKNKTARTNYLKLPADVLTHSGTTNEMTIGFWVNVKDAETGYFQCPVFSAYATSTQGQNNTFPMFRCSAKGVMQLNNGDGHWTDFTKEENDDEGKKSSGNTESTVYLDDAKWHYYTVTLTSTKGIIYVDGAVVNSWTIKSDDITPAFFTTAASGGYPVVCLGGNQSWDWGDWDASFGYDDFVVYDRALSAAQIAQIMADKNFSYTVVAKDGSGNTLKTIESGTYTGTAITTAYPQYIQSGNTLYNIANNGSGDYFRTTFTPNADNYEKILTYDGSTVSDVYYYVEAEDITGISQAASTARASCGKMGYTSNIDTYVSVLNLPAGTYQIYARPTRTNTGDATCKFKVGSDVKFTMTMSQAIYDIQNSTSFTIDKAQTLSIACEGSSTSGLDWLYVKGAPSNTVIGKTDNSTSYLTDMTEMVTLKPGESYRYKFVNHNGNGSDNSKNWVLPVYDSSDNKVIVLRADNWEDVAWANSGCTNNYDWTNFISEMNGATVDMAVSFTKDKKFTMSADIVTSTSKNWTYSYTSDYAGTAIDFSDDDYIKMALSVSLSWLEVQKEGQTAVSAKITDAGWSTFASPYPLDLSSMTVSTGDVAAYYASAASESTVTLAPTSAKIAAGEGIMIKGTAGATVSIPVTAETPTFGETNLLKGQTTTGNVAASTAGKYHYVFGYVTETPSTYGFYNLAADTEVSAGKAYLEIEDALSLARALSIVFDDDILTGINEAEAATEAVQKEGKFVVDGKLVIFKKGMKFNANGQMVK